MAREDHPKACTGRRLIRQGLVKEVVSAHVGLEKTILLDPGAPHPLSHEDAPRAHTHGILAVDCSWNRLAERGSYPTTTPWLARHGHRRRLPWLVATNPQHYGRFGELTTAEAFGAALAVIGETGLATRLLDGFAGGRAFFEVNGARLTSYARAPTVAKMSRVEEAQFGGR
ncbi:MAG: DUF367 domain-containing protein [Thermoplasmata archaeon]